MTSETREKEPPFLRTTARISRIIHDTRFIHRILRLSGDPPCLKNGSGEPDRGSCSFAEFRAKLFAGRIYFDPFCAAFPRDHSFGLSDWNKIVCSLREHHPYERIWRLEGLAADLVLKDRDIAKLEGGFAEVVSPNPESRYTLLQLHTGAGTALARRLLGRSPCAADPREVCGSFFDAAERLAIAGHRACFLEPLGLMVRNLAPASVQAFVDCYESREPNAGSLFWHGVGRGYYFNPAQFTSVTRRVRRLHREIVQCGSSGTARANLLSGFLMALALVNIVSPEVTIRFLNAFQESAEEGDEIALSHGIASSFTVWMIQDPESDCPQRLLRALDGAAETSPLIRDVRRRIESWEVPFPENEAFFFYRPPGNL